jgi:hypothetical protein
MLSSVACLALKYFSTLSKNGTNFEKKNVIEHKICFVIIYGFCMEHFSFNEELREIGADLYWSPCKVSVILISFWWVEFPRQISEKHCYMKFNEHPCSGTEFFHADGQTDKTKLRIAFRSFVITPKVTEYERVIPIRCRRNNNSLMTGLGRYLDGVICCIMR